MNDLFFAIRQNLWDYLDVVTKHTSPDELPLMFIDQLCVNQTHIEERNHQVHQMANIYRSAKQVMCWLGPDTPASRATMKLLREWIIELPPRVNYDDMERALSETADLPEHDYNLIRGLLELEYWQRVWIVQEYVLAQDLLIRWGSETLTFDTLWGAASEILNSTMLRIDNDSHTFDDICLTREKHHQGQKVSWVDMMLIISGRHCEEPKDKVFALLGLNVDSAIRPDYSKTREEIFDEFAKEFAVQYAVERVRESKWQESEFRTWAYHLGLCGKALSETYDVSKYVAICNELRRKNLATTG